MRKVYDFDLKKFIDDDDAINLQNGILTFVIPCKNTFTIVYNKCFHDANKCFHDANKSFFDKNLGIPFSRGNA